MARSIVCSIGGIALHDDVSVTWYGDAMGTWTDAPESS